MRRQFQHKIKRIVVKIGTSMLASSHGGLDNRIIEELVNQICSLAASGKQIILVSSGAIASGLAEMGLKTRPQDLSSLQAAASIGQSILMQRYNDYFKKNKVSCAQVLLTWEDFCQRQRYLNARNTVDRLLEYKIIPIINENDAVSTDEIKFGDNDKLSALVANLVEADLLILLSDVEGLYRTKKDDIISVVEELNDEIKKLAKGTDKKLISRGGMISKLEAAEIVMHAGIPCVIANGKTKDIIVKILEGQEIGTLFLPKKDKLVARDRWIAFGAKTKGKIVVDDGAKEALLKKGKSLLCPGVVDLDGKFVSGDMVSIVDKNHKEFARGISNYSSGELKTIKGCKGKEEVIHRDNLVITVKE
ncbi:MAG: glutamate 5-kinase [Candidatus Omnitrophica bacterium]|nr:glutamate 5-kinase [Candidatus Omnitrophota bacterium]HOX54197.1 glutamate 5-kinase [Candidatus Omnitrophota bacterium]